VVSGEWQLAGVSSEGMQLLSWVYGCGADVFGKELLAAGCWLQRRRGPGV
jgi:hypothetical protein